MNRVKMSAYRLRLRKSDGMGSLGRQKQVGR
jgi:hypothetical protein